MLRNKLSLAVKVAGLAVVAGLLNPGRALAILTVTNTGTVAFQNDALVAQPTVASSTLVDVAGNPLLTVTKMVEGAPAVHARGSTLFYRIVVAYPQIQDAVLGCGDDSAANAVTITDDLFPSGFAYVPNTTSVSVDDGGSFESLTDGVPGTEGTASFAGTTLTTTFANPIPECSTQGAGTARVIRFQVTVQ